MSRRIRRRQSSQKPKWSLEEWIHRKTRRSNPSGISPHIAVRNPFISTTTCDWILPKGPSAVRRMRSSGELPSGFLTNQTGTSKRFFQITKRGKYWTITGTDNPRKAFRRNFFRLGGSARSKANYLRAISHQIVRYGLDYKGLRRLLFLFAGITARKLLGFVRKLPKVCRIFFSRRVPHTSC
jgi:hypothetical protein